MVRTVGWARDRAEKDTGMRMSGQPAQRRSSAVPTAAALLCSARAPLRAEMDKPTEPFWNARRSLIPTSRAGERGPLTSSTSANQPDPYLRAFSRALRTRRPRSPCAPRWPSFACKSTDSGTDTAAGINRPRTQSTSTSRSSTPRSKRVRLQSRTCDGIEALQADRGLEARALGFEAKSV